MKRPNDLMELCGMPLGVLCIMISLFAGCETTSKPINISDVNARKYQKIVEVINNCDVSFYSAWALVKDRKSAEHMQECFKEAMIEYESLEVEFKDLPALSMPESETYINLLSGSNVNFSEMPKSPLPNPISSEMDAAIEAYMQKHTEICIRFGLVLSASP